jgi:hypothetical protein
MKWIKPSRHIVAETASEVDESNVAATPKTEKIAFWVRVKNGEAVIIYEGGWLSVLTMGFFSHNANVSKSDGFADLGEHIRIKVED